MYVINKSSKEQCLFIGHLILSFHFISQSLLVSLLNFLWYLVPGKYETQTCISSLFSKISSRVWGVGNNVQESLLCSVLFSLSVCKDHNILSETCARLPFGAEPWQLSHSQLLMQQTFISLYANHGDIQHKAQFPIFKFICWVNFRIKYFYYCLLIFLPPIKYEKQGWKVESAIAKAQSIVSKMLQCQIIYYKAMMTFKK